MQGTVTASQLRIRQEPSLSEPIIGHYPQGTVITLLCQTPGAMVIDNSLWDRTNMGYVSDKYVSRPPRTTPPSTTRTKLPTCDPMPRPTTGVVYGRIAASQLRIRRAPSTSSPVLGSYNQGEMVSILCQTPGTDYEEAQYGIGRIEGIFRIDMLSVYHPMQLYLPAEPDIPWKSR